jgi:hypothetical protein
MEKSCAWWCTLVIPEMVGILKKEDCSPGKKQDPISKITREKRNGGMVQAVEYLCSKCEALNST